VIKRITLVRRRDGMSKEDFERHWTTTHAALARRLPGIRGCRINIARPAPGETLPWDGVGEVWFDSEAEMEAAFEAMADEFAADRALFIGEAVRFVVEEHVVVAEPRPE
jgi:uncharacterized protein (TIGR02118 family)